MTSNNQETRGLNVQDVLFVIFRHKWKILLLTLLGLLSAGVVYVLGKPQYLSEAKLLVRYVVERSAVDAIDSQVDTSGRSGSSLIAAEIEILSSWDLAVQVAEAIGSEKLLADGKEPGGTGRAVSMVRNGLEVTAKKGSNVLNVTFRNGNRDLSQPILDEYVRRYFDKHLEVHRSVQAFDFVSQQRDQVRARLVELQDKLKRLKDQADITSLVDSTASVNSRLASVRENLLAAETTRAEQSARLTEMDRLGETLKEKSAENSAETTTPKPVPPEQLSQYQALTTQLVSLRKTELQLLAQFTSDNTVVKVNQAQIRALEERRRTLELKFPQLTALAVGAVARGTSFDSLTEHANLAAADARVATLRLQLAELETSAAKIHAVSGQIEDLERQKEVETKSYANFQSKLETARVDEALDPSKMPNISVVQKPSPPMSVAGQSAKIALGLAIGGFPLGVALALAMDLIFDRTVKRPAELERRLGIPMLLNIPNVAPNRSRRALPDSRGGGSQLAKTEQSLSPKSAPWEEGHFIRPYAEIIRDRIILGFELRRITHKPKLVAVTSLSGGEGTSTLAAGLAASLSETGDGKVLLVDMSAGNPELRPFFEGRASGSLVEALQGNGEPTTAADNLFLATGEMDGRGSTSIAPRRFYELMPVLRASQFDYIIFDLPPVDQSGATLAVSGSMDKVLLVVEAEKNNRNALKRAYDELVAAKADVVAVVNKTRDQGPKWIQS